MEVGIVQDEKKMNAAILHAAYGQKWRCFWGGRKADPFLHGRTR